jgi:hypothetical protein
MIDPIIFFYTVGQMPVTSYNIPVRLSDDVIARIDDVSETLGMTRSAFIKFCTRTFLDSFEAKGVAMMPPDWENILKEYDGRTHRYARSNEIKDNKGPVLIHSGDGDINLSSLRAATPSQRGKGKPNK